MLPKPRVSPKINGKAIIAIQQIELKQIAQQTDPDTHVNHEKHVQLVQHVRVVQHDIGSQDLRKFKIFKI